MPVVRWSWGSEYARGQSSASGTCVPEKNKLELGDGSRLSPDVMPFRLKRSRNMTSNCIRYAKEMVWISVEENEEQLKVTIRDDGPGILKTIFLICSIAFIKGRANHRHRAFHRKTLHGYMGGDIAMESYSPSGPSFDRAERKIVASQVPGHNQIVIFALPILLH